MVKPKSHFVCQNCGAIQLRWAGQCTVCGEWNTMVEETIVTTKSSAASARAQVPPAISLKTVSESPRSMHRSSTTVSELDRVLGGEPQNGMVPGAVMLLGGPPGIGKSTLLTQVVLGLAKEHEGVIAYVCGEENPDQIYLRIKRILSFEHKKIDGDLSRKISQLEETVQFLTTTDVDEIAAYVERVKPILIIVDSIQTITTTDLSGVAGSIGQVRECADRLTRVAKRTAVPVFLVGHITKEGKLAGPMVLEHVVDTVLELSGDRSEEIRLLRAIKNRFGATDEVGVFRMGEGGYESVQNPSEVFLGEHEQPPVGAAVACVLEGTRPLMVEVQALAVRSYLPSPRRVGRGIDGNRLHVLTAVIEKYLRIPLSSYDVFVSLTGGFVTKEPAIDLAVCIALVSSLANQPVKEHSVCIGEVGLLGEIRMVPLFERRLKEATRLGYSTAITAKNRTLLNALTAAHLPLPKAKPKKNE